MSASAPSSNRIAEMDLLRGYAIAAVVGLHVTRQYLAASDLSTTAGRAVALAFLLTGFGVPLFLALSSAGLALRYSQAGGLADHLRFLWNRGLRLLPAYIAWSLVSAALFQPEAFHSVRSVLRMLATGSAEWPFYFIPLLFEIYVLWPLMRPLARYCSNSWQRGAGVAAGGFACSIAWWKLLGAGAVPTGILFAPMLWIGYVALGIAVAPHLQKLRTTTTAVRLVATAIVPLAALAMYWGFLDQVVPHYRIRATYLASSLFQIPPTVYALTIMGALAVHVSASRKPAGRRLLHGLGTNSYGIFLAHMLVLRVVMNRLLPPEAIHGASLPTAVALVLACWAGCLALTLGLVALLSHSAWTRPLVSNRG